MNTPSPDADANGAPPADTRKTVISVVIPTHQRRESVLETLRSLGAQDLRPDLFEVIVVVDGSTDGTADAIRSQTWPYPLKIVEQPQQGQGAARNRGAERADGTGLMFLDDDMVIGPGYLRMVSGELSSGVDVVLTTVELGSWVPDTIITGEIRGWYEEERHVLMAGEVRFGDLLMTGHAVRAELFRQVGGFDESFTAGGAYGNEDIELGHRLLSTGATVRYLSDAIAQVDGETDPDTILRRVTEIAANDARLVRKHPELAVEVYGRKFRHSRIHRAIGPSILKAPWLVHLAAPVRRLLVRVLANDRRVPHWAARSLFRAWFVVREGTYWASLARAGGRPEAEQVWRSTRSARKAT